MVLTSEMIIIATSNSYKFCFPVPGRIAMKHFSKTISSWIAL
jgi:hypothetical protein